MLKYKITLLSALLGLNACNSIGRASSPLLTSDFPPQGPANYQQGMVDGCKTAATTFGAGTIYGVIYNKYYYDVNQGLGDHVYQTAWNDGFRYCKFSHDATITQS